MDLPPELPCYNCGRMVSRSRKRAMPTLGLPDLPPRYYGRIGSEGAMRAISELGHVPRGTHFSQDSYYADLKNHIKKNWWCEDCYKKQMKELRDR